MVNCPLGNRKASTPEYNVTRCVFQTRVPSGRDNHTRIAIAPDRLCYLGGLRKRSLNVSSLALILFAGFTRAAQHSEPPADFAFMRQPENFHAFQHIDELGFRLDPVRRGDSVFPLQPASGTFSVDYTWQGGKYTLDDYFARSFVLSFVVLKENRIVLEKYFHDAGPDSRFLSNSVAKSILSVMIGHAIESGRIESVNDRVIRYLPDLAQSGYKETTIKNLLQMSSGVKFDEAYLSPDSEIARFGQALLQGTQSFREFAATIQPKRKPGTQFEYQSINSQVLGLILERATGKPLHQYIQENLWSKIGVERDAFLYRGRRQADECAFGCFNATARDYARVGLMALHGGQLNGQRIVSEAWMRESTTPDATFLKPNASNGNLGYAYQWWVPGGSDGAFMAMGIYGQMIYVNPRRSVVIVQTSAWKLPDEDASWAESVALMEAAAGKLP